MIAYSPDSYVAFLRSASPGTTATIRMARAAGIPVWLRTQPDYERNLMILSAGAAAGMTAAGRLVWT
jgi:hypothetical protein